MAFISPSTNIEADDPLLQWLWLINQALEDLKLGNNSIRTDLDQLLSDCIRTFKYCDKYRDDIRFLKIWFLYLDRSEDFESVFMEMEKNRICQSHSLLYELYASFLEAKQCFYDALCIYQIGITRKAKPLDRLKDGQARLLDRAAQILDSSALQNDSHFRNAEQSCINPWSESTMKDMMKKINPRIMKYEGYHSSTKDYSRKPALSSLCTSSGNKIIELGRNKYEIKGCTGQGAFAQVFKAYENSNPDDVVALKIQKPAFPWEFYMYRQLDQRISENERSSFGFAHKIHLYSDCSVLVCGYLAHGTLQDAVNSYVVTGKSMEEGLCIYYTTEMLYMLETLYDIDIIHGDFKPDNLLIRYSRNGLTEEGFQDRSGPWHDQGLCLVDWGRGIDLRLFPDSTEFEGDSRTSGFRCIEMQENRRWKFQVDTYGLCVTVHMMLHSSYMEIQKTKSSDGSNIYMPKSSFKRYWNGELWKTLFTKLLNYNPETNYRQLLRDLRESFQKYMHSNPQLIRKLRDLLLKQRASLCSA